MSVAERFTTEYDDFEDRIRISHQLDSGVIVVTWLTHRLTDRLVAHLAAWLEKETTQTPRPDVWQSFAQEAAAIKLAQTAATHPHESVSPPDSLTEWLVREVDIKTQNAGASLQLRGRTPEEKCQLSLNNLQLRQWLHIVRSQYLRAQWSLTAWPGWLQPSESVALSRSHDSDTPMH